MYGTSVCWHYETCVTCPTARPPDPRSRRRARRRGRADPRDVRSAAGRAAEPTRAGGRAGGCRRLSAAVGPSSALDRPIRAQVFGISVRHEKCELDPPDRTDMLSTVLAILAVWVVGIPLVFVALMSMATLHDRGPVRRRVPRWRYAMARCRARRARRASFARRAHAQRSSSCTRAAVSPPAAPAVPAHAIRGRTRVRVNRGRDAQSLCQRGRRRPLRGR